MESNWTREINRNALSEFCHRYGVQRLASFGSVNRRDFTEESDIDILVEFLPDRVPGYVTFIRMQNELSERFFHGRRVDLNTPHSLSPHFRDDALSEARNLYVEAG